METKREEERDAALRADVIAEIVTEMARRMSYGRLATELGVSEAEVRSWQATKTGTLAEGFPRLALIAYRHGFYDLLNDRGLPSPSYEIKNYYSLLMAPVGYDTEPPIVPLICRPTKIAGYPVDFPLGLPASVLATNAKWIEFYARRGFDILTYKTVRTEYRDAHPWPNWVFLRDPQEMTVPFDGTVTGFSDFLPEDLSRVSMANSFGIPSLAPDAWQDDVKKARQVVREGHQVFIVSVVASTHESESRIIDDFVEVALRAKKADADVVELNYSCPNVQGDPVGEIYRSEAMSARISKAVKTALEETPLFVKIGYLAQPELRAFVVANAPWIDGIVAINTITARVVNEEGEATFPTNVSMSPPVERTKAGISGWAIKARAQEVSRNLVTLRQDLFRDTKKWLPILGLGGVLTESDAKEYLDTIGVDAVESCTGAFLNPNLGFEIRRDRATEQAVPSTLGFGLEIAGKVLKDVFLHPLTRSRIRIDRNRRRITVEPDPD